MLDPIILGHNPFFGIDHLSQEQGNQKSQRFADVQRVTEVLLACHTLGIRGMMMSTHPRASAVCTAMEQESQTLAGWRLYPLVPNIQKYIRGANEKGLVNVVLDTLSQASFGQKVSLVLRGGRGILGKDVRQAIQLLVDMELVPFSRRPHGAIFLHDSLTDLALGLGVPMLLEVFQEHVSRKYKVPAGFVTKNMPLLRQRLAERGWSEALVMASCNAAGFAMNPSQAHCVAALQEPGMTFVAMNTLASGHLAPAKAYQYLGQLPNIHAVVVGMSRHDHALETVHAIRQYMPCAQSVS